MLWSVETEPEAIGPAGYDETAVQSRLAPTPDLL